MLLTLAAGHSGWRNVAALAALAHGYRCRLAHNCSLQIERLQGSEIAFIKSNCFQLMIVRQFIFSSQCLYSEH